MLRVSVISLCLMFLSAAVAGDFCANRPNGRYESAPCCNMLYLCHENRIKQIEWCISDMVYDEIAQRCNHTQYVPSCHHCVNPGIHECGACDKIYSCSNNKLSQLPCNLTMYKKGLPCNPTNYYKQCVSQLVL